MRNFNPVAHVSLLAQQNGVRVQKILGYGEKAVAFPAKRLIRIGEMKDEDAYFSALHELGHIILRHEARRSDAHYTLATEYEAWKWSIDHAKYRPSQKMLGIIAHALGTYLAIYPKDRHLNATHPFWTLAKPAEARTRVAGPKGRLP